MIRVVRRGRVYPLACLAAVTLCAFTAAGHDRRSGRNVLARGASATANVRDYPARREKPVARARLAEVAGEGKTARTLASGFPGPVRVLANRDHGIGNGKTAVLLSTVDSN